MDRIRHGSGRTPQCLLRPKICNRDGNRRANPCERIRHARAEKTECTAEEYGRDRTHDELQRARDGRNDALPESLQDVAVDEQGREDGVHGAVDDEVGLPVGNDLLCPRRIRADKEREYMCPERNQENADSDGKRYRHTQTGTHAHADALILLCAVVLCRVRRHRIAEREHGHDSDGIDLLRRRIRRNGQRTEIV